VDDLRRELEALRRAAAAWRIDEIGPKDKAALPRLLEWFRWLEEEVDGTGKTGIQVLRRVVSEHARRNHLRLVIYGSVTPFILAIFGAAVNLVFSHLTPSIPSPRP
jgi:hypothetical protein